MVRSSLGERTAGDSRPYLETDGRVADASLPARRSREGEAVGGWEHREAARAARGAAPTLETGGRVADASLPYAFLT